MQFGAWSLPTDYSIDPAELGRAMEERGFESLFLAEHTHIPAARRTPWPSGEPLPTSYWHSLDPFVGLSTVAAVAQRLRIGTGICLVAQRDPIVTAKAVATLDHVSRGRMLFGIGGGWNVEEVENHGTPFASRFQVIRERVLAMKRIWTEDAAEFHGEFVNFDPIWSWPKPYQKPHPPILVGGNGPKTLERVVEYGDGWMPVNGREGPPIAGRIPQLRELEARSGRAQIPVTVFEIHPDPRQIEEFERLGVVRGLFHLPSAPRDEVLPLLDRLAALKDQFS